MKERNPQAEQMADESMLRNLAAQAEAIWPQERHLFERYRAASGRPHRRYRLRERRDHLAARGALPRR